MKASHIVLGLLAVAVLFLLWDRFRASEDRQGSGERRGGTPVEEADQQGEEDIVDAARQWGRERIARLEERFSSEAYDEEWAQTMQQSLGQSFEQWRGEYKPGLGEIDCRTSTCVLRLTYDSAESSLLGEETLLQWLMTGQPCGFDIPGIPDQEDIEAQLERVVFLECERGG